MARGGIEGTGGRPASPSGGARSAGGARSGGSGGSARTGGKVAAPGSGIAKSAMTAMKRAQGDRVTVPARSPSRTARKQRATDAQAARLIRQADDFFGTKVSSSKELASAVRRWEIKSRIGPRAKQKNGRTVAQQTKSESKKWVERNTTIKGYGRRTDAAKAAAKDKAAYNKGVKAVVKGEMSRGTVDATTARNAKGGSKPYSKNVTGRTTGGAPVSRAQAAARKAAAARYTAMAKKK